MMSELAASALSDRDVVYRRTVISQIVSALLSGKGLDIEERLIDHFAFRAELNRDRISMHSERWQWRAMGPTQRWKGSVF